MYHTYQPITPCRVFSESFDEFTEKNNFFFTFVSSIAELGLSEWQGW